MRITLLAYKLCLFLSFALLSISVHAQVFNSVKQIAERRVPWLAKSLVFNVIEPENGMDIFELSTKNNKVYIAASGSNAAAQALGWYLKYYCQRSMSHFGDNLEAPKQLPQIKDKIRISAAFEYRYALNYCTVSYSMSYYRWKDWERELDWMALNGVNLMLAPIGVEAIWQNTLKQMGYSATEISDFIAAPTFGAWWLMGNLEGWGGRVSQDIINQQVALQRNILIRAKSLGIEPVLQGFYGMVPTSLKNKFQVKVIPQGAWAGGFQRPDFLTPTDPFFEKLAQIYYAETKKLYGNDWKFFGGDPFHEGGSSKGVDVKESAAIIQKLMQSSFPKSTWVLQGWQANPSKDLLSALDKNKTLVIELFGENTNNWERRDGYNATPFVWSNVSNFGEKNGIYGKLQRFSDEVYRAKNSKYAPYLKGVGIIPEGIYNNPVNFDLMLELAWHSDKIAVSDWIKNYATYRYGKTNQSVEQAWLGFLQTAYSSPNVPQEGPSESIFCARPDTLIKAVSSWGTRKRNYDILKFKSFVADFCVAAPQFKNSETYQVDRLDFVRQVLANSADEVYANMVKSIQAKNESEFLKYSKLFKKMLLQQDSLLANHKLFTLNNWLVAAQNFAKTASDKSLTLKNAKTQITYWGPDTNPNTNLHEYANKEWNGILGSLYLSRWNVFESYWLAKIKGENIAKPDYYKMEKDWTEKKDLYPPKILSATELDRLIAEILE
ncbi:alpha-N-acetylglucosaminidase [Pedobacter sp. MW01-1-1]|uniref:alpha-N-acetylglucosaminidase n=1 Tax=Pedobacter sp. MW01-1-1 TaxID=3383027 RepID=UPI003FEF117E